jgi:YfiH family protein
MMREYMRKVSTGFDIVDVNDIKLLKIPSFSREGFFKHCFTSRAGGVSEGCFASLNLSKTREANEANKRKNYNRVCDAIGVEYGSLTLVNYAHGSGVHCATARDAGKGMGRESDFAPCDGMVTDAPEVTVLTLHADCMPIFMADRRNRAAGVSHAGWKGVGMNIAGNMLEKLKGGYGSRPGDILVGIGPHIMDCCFEVREDVAGVFRNAFGGDVIKQRDGALFVSLQNAVMTQLREAGIPPENITCANLCTSCRDDLFFSHRRDRGMTGAMGSFITV